MFKRFAAPIANLLRYGVAIAGPIGSAAAQFLLSLVLLKVLDQAAFGRFSFLLIASQLSWGVWSALFCAPLPVLLSQNSGATRERALGCLFTVNFAGALLAGLLFFALVLLLDATPLAAGLFAGYCTFALLRWFARAYAYAIGRPLRTTASDVAYTVTLLAGIVLLQHYGTATLAMASTILLAGAAIGLVPFGRDQLARQFLRLSPRDVSAYGAVWRQHSGWSLLGVVTTEATANSHVYLVTAILGPSAFAPIAASSLMIRPISVAMNALTDFERPRLARQIEAKRFDLALAGVRFFRFALMLVWLATAIAVLVLLVRAPHVIFPPRYDIHFLETGTALWMLVGAMRLLRTPDSALLQAAGAFRPLAFASVWSSGLSIVAVLGLLIAVGPLWSIAGILIGESAFAVFTWRQSSAWLAKAPIAPLEISDPAAPEPA